MGSHPTVGGGQRADNGGRRSANEPARAAEGRIELAPGGPDGQLAVHGGAGTTPEDPDARQVGLVVADRRGRVGRAWSTEARQTATVEA